MDLRNDPQIIQKLAKNKQNQITTEQGEQYARSLKAVKYVECSALTQVNTIDTLWIFWEIQIHCKRCGFLF